MRYKIFQYQVQQQTIQASLREEEKTQLHFISALHSAVFMRYFFMVAR